MEPRTSTFHGSRMLEFKQMGPYECCMYLSHKCVYTYYIANGLYQFISLTVIPPACVCTQKK